MLRNSTIRQKIGICALCTDGKEKPLTKGMCQNHYWNSIKMRSVERQQVREISQDEGFMDLVKDADTVFSRYVRMSAADAEGFIRCFICGAKVRWQEGEAMHYVKRGNMLLRYDLRNVKAGEKICNQYKGGNYMEFTKKLELDSPGVTSFLLEEANIAYKYTRDELKQVIAEYSNKIRLNF